MKQGVFKYIFVLAFIVLLIIAYVVFNDDDTEQEVQDQTSTVSTILTNLRLGIAEFDSLNPLLSNNKSVKEVSRLIFDSLVTIGSDYSLEYSLITDIAKSDNLTYILTLRQGVKWHDGSEFTANDVKFTIDTIKNTVPNCSYAENLQYVSGLEIIDSYTVKITLSQEVEFFEYNLTFPILSASYFENEDFVNTEKNSIIIGTGMFVVTEKTDSGIVLKKNENYWNEDKEALITEINITLYSTVSELYTAFKTGYIDIMEVGISNISDYIGSLGYTQKNFDTRSVDFLCFNTISNEMLAEGNVRKAIALLLDKSNIVANLGSGYSTTNFLFTSNYWAYDSKLDYSYDSEEADNLLAEARMDIHQQYMGKRWKYT